MNCGKPNHFGVLLQLYCRKYAVWVCDHVFSLKSDWVSVSFFQGSHSTSVQIHHSSSYQSTLYTVRASYGENKRNLKTYKNDTSLGKNNFS